MSYFKSIFRFLFRRFRLIYFYRFRGYKKKVLRMFPEFDLSFVTEYQVWSDRVDSVFPFPFGILFPTSWLPSRFRVGLGYKDLPFDIPSSIFGYAFILAIGYGVYLLVFPSFHSVFVVDDVLDPQELAESLVSVIITPEAEFTQVPDFSESVFIVTPTPVFTATATLVPTEFYEFSFYDPSIGKYYPEIADINCADFRILIGGGYCASNLANGDRHELWYGRGAACPPGHSLGDRFEVFSPEALIGTWECVDRGRGIEGKLIDFLLKYPDHPYFADTGWDLRNIKWREPVELRWLN